MTRLGWVVVVAALLGSAAQAQVVPVNTVEPANANGLPASDAPADSEDALGCWGFPRLHCGVSTTLFELRPGMSAPAQLAPGLGPELDYHFRLWMLGGALFLNGLVPLHSNTPTPPGELGAAVFACAGPEFPISALSGACAGPLLAFVPTDLRSFVWRQALGLVLSLSPDMIQKLMSTVAVIAEEL